MCGICHILVCSCRMLYQCNWLVYICTYTFSCHPDCNVSHFTACSTHVLASTVQAVLDHMKAALKEHDELGTHSKHQS